MKYLTNKLCNTASADEKYIRLLPQIVDTINSGTLIKEIDFEMVKYRRMMDEYHREAMKRVKKRIEARRS